MWQKWLCREAAHLQCLNADDLSKMAVGSVLDFCNYNASRDPQFCRYDKYGVIKSAIHVQSTQNKQGNSIDICLKIQHS